MQTKTLTIEQMDDAGTGLARLAILSTVDHDGDTYARGAFGWVEGGQWVPILPAHQRTSMPVGKARVYEDGDAAYAELHLNMDSAAGREWHAALKFDLQKGKPAQEWSYGYGVLDSQLEMRGGDRVRVLKRLDVHEVSPVVRGAGLGSATLGMKSHGSFGDQLDALITALTDATTRAAEVKALREEGGRALGRARIDQLAAIKARIDTLISPAAATDTQDERMQAERLAADYLTRAARQRLGL